MKKCQKCGKENVDGAKFCRYCGTWLGSENQTENQTENVPEPVSAPVTPPPLLKLSHRNLPNRRSPLFPMAHIEGKRVDPDQRYSFLSLCFYWLQPVVPSGTIMSLSRRRLTVSLHAITHLRRGLFCVPRRWPGIDANKLGTLQYGSELIVYNYSNDWAYVKSTSGKKGYVASDFLMEKKDFYILNSIWGDSESALSSLLPNAAVPC